ncbi:uncharacterized protein LOC144158540 isoform X2 [Haemaphysalis longicornis]
MSTDRAHRRRAPRCQKTQTNIATGSTGTQCGLMLLISTCSQTEAAFPVRKVDYAKGGAWEKFSASRDGADTVAETRPDTCPCPPHSSSTGTFCNATKETLCGPKLHFCLSSHKRTHQATQGIECGNKMPYICPVCKKSFSKNSKLDIHMRVHTGESCKQHERSKGKKSVPNKSLRKCR